MNGAFVWSSPPWRDERKIFLISQLLDMKPETNHAIYMAALGIQRDLMLSVLQVAGSCRTQCGI